MAKSYIILLSLCLGWQNLQYRYTPHRNATTNDAIPLKHHPQRSPQDTRGRNEPPAAARNIGGTSTGGGPEPRSKMTMYMSKHLYEQGQLLSPVSLQKGLLNIKEDKEENERTVYMHENDVDNTRGDKTFFDLSTASTNTNMLSLYNGGGGSVETSLHQATTNNYYNNAGYNMNNYENENVTNTSSATDNSVTNNAGNYSFSSFNDNVFSFKENNEQPSPTTSPPSNLPLSKPPPLPALIVCIHFSVLPAIICFTFSGDLQRPFCFERPL